MKPDNYVTRVIPELVRNLNKNTLGVEDVMSSADILVELWGIPKERRDKRVIEDCFRDFTSAVHELRRIQINWEREQSEEESLLFPFYKLFLDEREQDKHDPSCPISYSNSSTQKRRDSINNLRPGFPLSYCYDDGSLARAWLDLTSYLAYHRLYSLKPNPREQRKKIYARLYSERFHALPSLWELLEECQSPQAFFKKAKDQLWKTRENLILQARQQVFKDFLPKFRQHCDEYSADLVKQVG